MCIHPVPEPAPPKPSPCTANHVHPASPTLPLSFSFSCGNEKRTSCSSQLQSPVAPQPQCTSSSAGARYPPREVPPRFRQQEQKQLLKRGQPLPAGAFGALTPSSSCLSPSLPYSSSSTSTSSTTPKSAEFPAGQQHSPGLCTFFQALHLFTLFLHLKFNFV